MSNIVESQRQPRFSPQFSMYIAIPVILVTGFFLLLGWFFLSWLVGEGWQHHRIAIVVTGLAILLAAFARPIALGVFAIRQHDQDMRDREARRKILDAQAYALQINAARGFNTEVRNDITGDVINVVNPASLAPASKVTNNYLEAPADDQEEDESEIEQPTVEEVVAQISRNSYKIGLGRSLSTGKLLVVNLLKKHIKVIGASQMGKSSMAGALMRIMTQTHDPNHLQIALLDLENQTCHLFEDLPHVVLHRIDGRDIPLIARSHEEVLLYLGYLIDILNYRYKLTKRQVKQLPLIIVYLEELIALKDYFKSRAKAKIKGAEQDYIQLVFNIKEIARRGLKARIQLLACAQCDYRDEDLVEAWVNVKNGVSFSVSPTAAQAAGFMQYELLVENAADSMPGQFVCEMSEVKDLGLAPWFDLEQLLIEWEEEQERLEESQVEGSLAEYQRPYLIATNGRAVNFQETSVSEEISANERIWAENLEVGTDNYENLPEKGLPEAGSQTSETSEAQEDGKYRFTESEKVLVKELYKAYRNIDKVLRHMKRGARWQTHASEILKEEGWL